MSLKSPLIKKVDLSIGKQTVNFIGDIEFTILPIHANAFSRLNYLVENVKGDFEIIKLVYRASIGFEMRSVSVPFDSETKTFSFPWHSGLNNVEIHIMANVDFQPVVSITRRLEIPKERFEFLEPNQMFIDYIVLSNSTKNVSYKFYGKKIDKENIEVHIENPVSTGVKLNGKTGDFHYSTKLQDINLMLSFIFEIPHFDEQTFVECESRPESISSTDEKSESEENDNVLQKNLPQNVPSIQVPETDEPPTTEQTEQAETISEKKNPVVPETVASESPTTEVEEECPCNCKWYKMSKNKDSTDMVLITSDAKIFAFHHSFLSKHSTKFAKIYQTSEVSPIFTKIDLHNRFLQAIISFLNGNSDSIKNVVKDQYKIYLFADEWKFPSLMATTFPKFEAFIEATNVCEVIQLAFKKDLEETMKFCKKYIFENKEKIAELGKLSPEILSYVFSS
uniref:BTB domain-containing protein n=1 Tax=Panagrolaimus davidi TaxID=227884 RepID=A0A914QVI4_9BILA